MTILELLLAFLSTYGQKVATQVPETADSLTTLATELANSGLLQPGDSAAVGNLLEALGTLPSAVVQDAGSVVEGALGAVASVVEAPVQAIAEAKTE